jgi:glycosyltransferase involved in cell wall biosynthesis
MRLSVVIPVYNEKATIGVILQRVEATGLADEIVVVDDGSSDGTRNFLAEIAAGHKSLRLLLQRATSARSRRSHRSRLLRGSDPDPGCRPGV